MKKACVAILCFLLLGSGTALAEARVPQALAQQVQRLVALLSDGVAEGYPEATQVQTLKAGAGQEITLVVFTVESFAGGNNYNQYLAVFSPRTLRARQKPYFMLMDVMLIGGRGWRAVDQLHARVISARGDGEAELALEALENTENDAENFPSRKVSVHIVLKGGRLFEQKAAGPELPASLHR